jgi:hypothetical protein
MAILSSHRTRSPRPLEATDVRLEVEGAQDEAPRVTLGKSSRRGSSIACPYVMCASVALSSAFAPKRARGSVERGTAVRDF